MDNEAKKEQLIKRFQGMGIEIGGGVATDFATSGLLGFGPLGWLGYGAINFGQGAYTNYLVQKHLYGEDELNWGEILASGAAGMIPFMNIGASKGVAKVVGQADTLKRGIVGGALTGIGSEQLRVGIDEQRMLNPLEAVTAGGLGGTIGGAFKLPGAIKNQRLQRQFGPGGTRMKFQRRFIKPDGTYDFEKAEQIRSRVSEGALSLEGMKEDLIRRIDSQDYKGFTMSNRVQGALEGSDLNATPLGPRVLPENASIRLTDSLDLLDNSKKNLYKLLDDSNRDEVEQILFNIDNYIMRGEAGSLPTTWNPGRPTYAFPGKKTVKYTKKDGTESEMGFRWSASQPTVSGKGAIIPYDVPAAEATVKARYKWDQPSSAFKRSGRNTLKGLVKTGNKAYDAYMKWLKKNKPALYFRIIEDSRANKSRRPWYIEHKVAQKANIWEEDPVTGIFYHKFRLYAAGDPENMEPIMDSVLGTTKTDLEKYIYSQSYQRDFGKHFGSTDLTQAHYVDFDLTDLIIRSTYDNAEIYRISALTNPKKVKAEVKYAIENGSRPRLVGNAADADVLTELDPIKRPELGITDEAFDEVDKRFDPPKSVDEFVSEASKEIDDQLDFLTTADYYYGTDMTKYKSNYVDIRDPNLRKDAENYYDLFKTKASQQASFEQMLLPGFDEYYISQIMIKLLKQSKKKYGG